MNNPGGFVTRDTRIFEAALWAAAGAVTTAAYVGLAVWILRVDPIVAADANPPAAIMIEIAEAQAAATLMNEITPDLQTAEESVPLAAAKQEETSDDEKLLEPEKPEHTKDIVLEPKPAPVKEVEVPLPMVQPKREKPKPRDQQAARQSKPAIQAQARVLQSDRTAAMQTTSGVSAQSPASWQSSLMAHLERRKRYPSGAMSRGERGTVYVRFSIDGAGNVLSAALARSSGFSELDQEVLSLVRRASPVPAPPPGANRTITAPVRFSTS